MIYSFSTLEELRFNEDTVESRPRYPMNTSTGTKGKSGRVFLWRVIFASAILGVSCFAFAEELTFRFNPPDRATYIETVKTTRVKDMGSFGNTTDVGETSAKITIQRTSDGYEVEVTPLSMTMSRNGQVVNNPTTLVLLDTIVRYKLDSDGRLLTIRGYETVLDRMQQVLPPAAVQALGAVFGEEALIKKETAEWNGRIGSFLGQRAKVGDVFTGTEAFPLPTGGTVAYYSVTEIAEETKCGGEHDCVRIRFTYNTDAETLGQTVGTVLSDVSKAVGASDVAPGISGVEIIGSGERLIDPRAMLIYSETRIRTIKMLMDVPGQARVPTTMQETKEYSFAYST